MPRLRSLSSLTLILVLLPAATAAQAKPDYHRVAVATERIARGRLDVRIFQGTKLLHPPSFRELLVVTPVNHDRELNYLTKQSIVLVPSDKHKDQWNVYTEAVRTAARIRPAAFVQISQREGWQVLADNVYKVRMVLVSTRQQPVVVQADGHQYRLKAGEALLALG